ncbi:MAG TPA: di-trans,poly-cis-decaprenylcistransferase [Planctomycetaceae bacterium]|nr:di-trans,poly-cis-decaprenylcistransferase [Planctomycetaceae bacterium]
MPRETAYTDEQLAELGLQRSRLARHIAIIMDGNGRWAQQRGFPRIEGHRQGVHSVRAIVEESSRIGLEQLTLYCFSSENWKRPRLELSLLMKLLRRYLVEERKRIQEQGLRFKVIGRTEELDPGIQREIELTEEAAAENDGMMLCLAVNYGARMEITEAIQSIARKVQSGELTPDSISEQTVADHLMTSGMPDPDLVIRTASEMRISNYLLWQISYSELWVTDCFWPEFREPHLHEALKSFAARDRRFGGLKDKSATSASA